MNHTITNARMMIHKKLPPTPGAGRRRGLLEGGVLGFGVGLEGMRDPLVVSYRRLHVPCAGSSGRRPHPETTHAHRSHAVRIAKAAQPDYARENSIRCPGIG